MKQSSTDAVVLVQLISISIWQTVSYVMYYGRCTLNVLCFSFKFFNTYLLTSKLTDSCISEN